MTRKGCCASLLAVMLVLAVSSWGCASKQHKHNFGSTQIVSAKELHLRKKLSSPEMETLKEPPKMSWEEYERLGDHYHSQGDLGKAFVQYEKSLKLNPDNSVVHYKKGLLLVIGRMNEDAISEFEKVLRKDPKHALSHEGLSLAYFQMEKYDDAEARLRRAVELDPKLWRAHNLLGIIYDQREQYNKAIDAYEAAIALKENNGLLYNNLGISCFLAGDYEEAIKAFNKALATKRAPDKISNNLGLVLSSVGKYREAFEAFRKGGDEAQAYNNLGCAYLEQEKYKEATRCFEKAIELRPTFYTQASENLRKALMAPDILQNRAERNFRQDPTVANFDKLLHANQLSVELTGSLREKPVGWRGAKPGTVHTVSKGDTLFGISRQYYGSPSYWDIIFMENSAIIGNNPEYLRVGLKLVIP